MKVFLITSLVVTKKTKTAFKFCKSLMYCYGYFKHITNYMLLRTRGAKKQWGSAEEICVVPGQLRDRCVRGAIGGTWARMLGRAAPRHAGRAALARRGCGSARAALGFVWEGTAASAPSTAGGPCTAEHGLACISPLRAPCPARRGTGPPSACRTPNPAPPHRRPRAGSAQAGGALRMLSEPRPRRLRRGRRGSAGRRPTPPAPAPRHRGRRRRPFFPRPRGQAPPGRPRPAPGRGRCAPAPARPTHRRRGAAGGGRARPAAPAPRLR